MTWKNVTEKKELLWFLTMNTEQFFFFVRAQQMSWIHSVSQHQLVSPLLGKNFIFNSRDRKMKVFFFIFIPFLEIMKQIRNVNFNIHFSSTRCHTNELCVNEKWFYFSCSPFAFLFSLFKFIFSLFLFLNCWMLMCIKYCECMINRRLINGISVVWHEQ